MLPKRSSVARLGALALSGNFSASATWRHWVLGLGVTDLLPGAVSIKVGVY